MLRAPEVCPVSAIGGTEPEILQNDGDEEPHHYFAAGERAVERWDVAGVLAVVVWEALKEDEPDAEHDECDGDGYACESGTICYKIASADACDLKPCQLASPVPKYHDVELLSTLYQGCAKGPDGDGNASCKHVSFVNDLSRGEVRVYLRCQS